MNCRNCDAPDATIPVDGGCECPACYQRVTDAFREEDGRPDIAEIRDAYVAGGFRGAMDVTAGQALASLRHRVPWFRVVGVEPVPVRWSAHKVLQKAIDRGQFAS